MKRIRKNITKKEYLKLKRYLENDNNLRTSSKRNLTTTITILYHTGIRITEISSFKVKNLKELITTNSTIIKTAKTNSEREIFISKTAKKEIIELYEKFYTDLEDNVQIVYPKNSKFDSISKPVLIRQTNDFLRKVLGSGFSSHSFRSSLITDLARQGANIGFIQQYIGHKSLQATQRYIKPEKNDLINMINLRK